MVKGATNKKSCRNPGRNPESSRRREWGRPTPSPTEFFHFLMDFKSREARQGVWWVFGVLHGTCASLLGQGLHMGSPVEQGPYRTGLPYSILYGTGSAYRPGHFCGVPQDPIWNPGLPFGAVFLYGHGAPLYSRAAPMWSHTERGSLMGFYMGQGLPCRTEPCVVPYGAGLPRRGRARSSVLRDGGSRPGRCLELGSVPRARVGSPGSGRARAGTLGSGRYPGFGSVPRVRVCPPRFGPVPVPPALGPVPPPRPPRHFPGRALGVRRGDVTAGPCLPRCGTGRGEGTGTGIGPRAAPRPGTAPLRARHRSGPAMAQRARARPG